MINIVKKYLEVCKFSDKKENFEDLFLSHPNYPSLFAITDSLDMLSIENVAIKIPKEQFVELPESFLAMFNDAMVMVSKTETSVTIETEERKKQILTFNEFLSGWNEVVLAIEPNTNPLTQNEKTTTKWLLYILPCIALVSLSLFFNSYGFNEFFLLATSSIGLIFGIFVLQEKLGIKNEVASKLCSLNVNASCDSVIKSNKSDINKWVDFSDLPLLFFAISVVSILIQPKSSVAWITFLSLLAIPIIAYSIWLQKFELKKWCVLCLLIASIIVLQSFVFGLVVSLVNILSVNAFGVLFSGILISSFWFLVKPVLNQKLKFEKETNELKRFKRDYGLFKFLSKDIPKSDGLDVLKGIQIGKNKVDVQLTIIISPSCGHCHKAFEDAYKLVKQFPERISLKVLFNVNPKNSDNPYRIVVDSLLTINNANTKTAEDAIVDWHINKMGLEIWKQKWAVTYVDMLVNHQIHQQYNWCLQNEFNYTPVKIINNKLFPNEYDITELKYFLNEFSKENEENCLLAKA